MFLPKYFEYFPPEGGCSEVLDSFRLSETECLGLQLHIIRSKRRGYPENTYVHTEKRGNETGKVAIAHGSVGFCEAIAIGLADES